MIIDLCYLYEIMSIVYVKYSHCQHQSLVSLSRIKINLYRPYLNPGSLFNNYCRPRKLTQFSQFHYDKIRIHSILGYVLTFYLFTTIPRCILFIFRHLSLFSIYYIFYRK
jgi:hypothetical protein